jgi:hypothetical protein
LTDFINLSLVRLEGRAGVNYNFSKTARAYVRHDSHDYGTIQAVPAVGGNKQTRTADCARKSY